MAKTNGDHPKSYSRFTWKDVERLGIELRLAELMRQTPSVAPSAGLLEALNTPAVIQLGSEKAKSEFLIAPIVREIVVANQQKVAVFSGYEFDVDAEQGLTGSCDYIFSHNVQTPLIKSPVFFVTEAKNENLESGGPQCVAEMYAASIFNERAGQPQGPIFGAVTFGREWQFFRFDQKIAYRDAKIYALHAELPRILGILQAMIDA